MRCLTLTQPYASLVAIGVKSIETRSWRTNYQGPIAIHAAAGFGGIEGGRKGFYDLCYSPAFLPVLEPVITGTREIAGEVIPHIDPGGLLLGAVIATAELVDCIPTEQLVQLGEIPRFTMEAVPLIWMLTDQERAFGDYAPGRFAWLLANVKPLVKPIPAKGALGLWEWDAPEGVEL